MHDVNFFGKTTKYLQNTSLSNIVSKFMKMNEKKNVMNSYYNGLNKSYKECKIETGASTDPWTQQTYPFIISLERTNMK